MSVRKWQVKLFTKRHHGRGQGLAEFAVTLPLLLMVLAGLLEVANLLVLYSRMEIAARESARFGGLGGTDNGVREIFRQTAGDGLEVAPGIAEVWVVRPELYFDTASNDYMWAKADADNPWGQGVEVVCVYPTEGCETGNSGLDPAAVIEQVNKAGKKADGSNHQNRAIANGDRFVVVAVYYEAKTILNLPFFKVASGETGRVPLRAISVFRQEVEQTSVNMLASGCSAYPISISSGVNNGTTALTGAREGNKFTVTRGDGGFHFLTWNPNNADSGDALSNSLAYPGNSTDTNGWGYSNPYVAGDTALNRGDYVRRIGGSVSIPTSHISEHITRKRTLRVIIHDEAHSWEFGPSVHIDQNLGFAIIRIVSYDAAAQTMRFEFVRFDSSCGESGHYREINP